jgi:4-hydroxy-tetrahydrodipicolinate reductase
MKIAIAGCSGRMGLALVQAVLARPDLTLVCSSERPGFDAAAVNAQLSSHGCHNLLVTSDPEQLVEKADAVIDFTAPSATLSVAKAIANKGGVHIVGTTGFTSAEQQQLAAHASKARIVQSGNFSLGVNLLEMLVEQTAKKLADEYDIEIYEMHHKHKKDAPSGTALMLGRAAAKGRSVDLEKKKVLDRNQERKRGDIGFAVERGGDIVGILSVTFAGPGEVIELKHQAFSRNIYTTGALKAAEWATRQKPGLYSMRDVLGL